MADKIFLTNDGSTGSQPQGYEYEEEVIRWNFANTASVHGASAVVGMGIARSNGRIVNFYLGVDRIAVSASGFVSADVTAQPRINSAAVLSTAAAIVGPVGSAGQAVRKNTQVGGGTSAIVNTASAAFSAGDHFHLDYNALSVGSAAAGQSGLGLYAALIVRYTAR